MSGATRREDVGDVLIIGAGVAGATVAQRILEQRPSTHITVIDAGDRIDTKRRRQWWDYVISGELPYSYTYPEPGMDKTTGNVDWEFARTRMIAYGGTTVHWGGWTPRMQPEDFVLRTNTGEGGDWPISYSHLGPYYDEAEVLLGVCGDDKDRSSTPRSTPFPLPPYPYLPQDLEMIEKGFEPNGMTGGHMPLARHRQCMTTGTCRICPVSARFNGADFMDHVIARFGPDAIDVRCRNVATRILANGPASAAGVEVLDTLDGTTTVMSADRIVVANGAYEVPKLMMASADDASWPDGPGNASGALGGYIVTHSFLAVSGENNGNQERWIEEYDFPTLMSRSLDDEANQKLGKVFLVRDAQSPNTRLASLMQQGRSASMIDDLVTGPRQTSLSGFLEEKGRSENRISLERGTDRFGLPRMSVDFNRTPETVAGGWKQIAKMTEVVTSMGYRVTDQSFEAPAGFHVSGTSRMAAHPDHGVVDADLRVFGVDNLYVCSNSVFPSIGAVNPTLTLTALALRLGDHLVGEVSP